VGADGTCFGQNLVAAVAFIEHRIFDARYVIEYQIGILDIGVQISPIAIGVGIGGIYAVFIDGDVGLVIATGIGIVGRDIAIGKEVPNKVIAIHPVVYSLNQLFCGFCI